MIVRLLVDPTNDLYDFRTVIIVGAYVGERKWSVLAIGVAKLAGSLEQSLCRLVELRAIVKQKHAP